MNDPADVLLADVDGNVGFDVPKHLSLGVSIGYNFSDSTYGWNGFMDGFTVYYLHFTDTMEEQLSVLNS